MNTLKELIEKSRQFRHVSSVARLADGSETDGWGEAETVEFTFEDGETLTVGREVLRDPDFEMVQFRK